ncbi:hypothetical protein CC99x_008515 [Candidatus Berkiella cookevillensis]|uniref:Uncharacterized protein n=1 Tax=Candidatus Berkiella cookevillensis TaxID=437022 RepID=A0A0Q9YFH4_9GAMM|nr:hypothetical protein [Candidatus Berkiella cookevillensis]MCS5708942.1 hypothetical protein [Candidatus Berkiella cookevillensis]
MTNKLELDDAPTTLLFDKQSRKADKPKQAIPDRIYVVPCALAMAAQTLLNSQDPAYKPNINSRPQF